MADLGRQPDGTENLISVTLSVMCDTQEQAVRAMEVLQRPATGLALEGFNVNMHLLNVPVPPGD